MRLTQHHNRKIRAVIVNLLAVALIIMCIVAMWSAYKSSPLSKVKVNFVEECEPYRNRPFSELPAGCYWYFRGLSYR